MIFGAAMVWGISRYFYFGKISPLYIERQFHFTYSYFDWVTPLPGDGMYILFAIVGISAALIMIGLYYRLASAVFFLGYTYIFLLDQTEHNNHYYLICLLAFLFCFINANKWMALDNLRKRKFHTENNLGYVPYWNIFILKVQIVIVYFYGGIAKINMDWLRGEPMRGWLTRWVENDPDLPRLMASEFSVYFFSYGGLIFDLAIGFLLWQKRTRLLGIILLTIFHLTNHWMFTIGIFPFLMLGATILFLEPDTPRNFILNVFPNLKKDIVVIDESRVKSPNLPVVFVIIYLVVQILIPFRHWLYPGNVAWTDEGALFAWRMKLRSKENCSVNFMATNPKTGETWPIFPAGNLDYRQFKIMCGHPRMIAQYAKYLGARLEREGEIENPIIKVISKVSLNFRPHQPIIDPEANLLEVDTSPFHHAKWITSLKR